MSIDIKYISLSFINTENEILNQIKNTVLISYLFQNYKETSLLDYLESTQYGYTDSAQEKGSHKFVRITDINSGDVNWDNVPFCNCDAENKYLLYENDILIARTGGTTGKSFIVKNPPKNAVFASYLIRLRLKKDVNIKFINCFLNSYAFWSQIVEMKSGSAMPNVNAEKLKTLKLPKCDIQTQNEIVEIFENKNSEGRFQGLFEKVDKIETLYKDNQSVSTELTHQLSLVKQLRQSFLREAMQGKLTAEFRSANPELIAGENSAQALLNRIVAKAQSAKKGKELAPVSEDEIPFEIPESWVWCRLGEMAEFRRGPFGSALTKNIFVKDGYKVYEQKNAIYDDHSLGNYYITKERYDELKSFVVIKNDLIVSCSGTLGRISEIPSCAEKGIINQALMRIRLNQDLMYNSYFLSLFRSPYVQQLILSKSWGSAISNMVGLPEIKKILIPLPPLSEQQAIVSKLDELMRTCDELEASIRSSQGQNEMLLQQVLRKALEG